MLSDAVGVNATAREPPDKGEVAMNLGKIPKPVFISYAHKDNESPDAAKRWLDRLQEHLAPLVQQHDLTLCSDQEIVLGDDWHTHIEAHLNGARAAVLLVSPAFLASPYIRNSELPVLLHHAKDRGVKIVPVVLRPCLFEETRFNYPDPKTGPEEFTLASLQSAGSSAETLSEMTEGEQDRALLGVARTLAKLVGSSDEARPETDAMIRTPSAPRAGVPQPETKSPSASSQLIDTGGGAYVGGDVNAAGDFVGRDKIINVTVQSDRKLPTTPFQAPPPAPDHVLRPQELARLKQHLLDAAGQLLPNTVGLHGFGGAGKTTLARLFCADAAVREACPDGILWVPLGKNPPEPRAQIVDLVTALTAGCDGCATLPGARARLQEALDHRKVLLVLDGEKSTRENLSWAYRELEKGKADVSCIFNKARSHAPRWVQGAL